LAVYDLLFEQGEKPGPWTSAGTALITGISTASNIYVAKKMLFTVETKSEKIQDESLLGK